MKESGDDGSSTETPFSLVLARGENGELQGSGNHVFTTRTHVNNGAGREELDARLWAKLWSLDDELMVTVDTDVSASRPQEASSGNDVPVTKVHMHGNAIATFERSSLVSSLRVDRHRYDLTVTATKLR